MYSLPANVSQSASCSHCVDSRMCRREGGNTAKDISGCLHMVV
jgi:hypothetical protein